MVAFRYLYCLRHQIDFKLIRVTLIGFFCHCNYFSVNKKQIDNNSIMETQKQ